MRALYLLAIILMVACAKVHKTTSSSSQKDLTKIFEISKDELDKYKIEAAPAVIVPKKSEAISLPTPKPQKNGTTSKKKVKESPVVAPVVVVPPVPAAFSYPKDFPEEFKKYDEASLKIWKNYKPSLFVGEKFFIDIKYLGVTAGQIEMETHPSVLISGKRAYHLSSKLKSADYYRYVYQLEDRLDTYIEEENFRPLKYQLEQRESGQNVDDLQLFDHEKLKTSYWYRREKKDQPEKKEQSETFVPRYFQDSFSALYFARGFPYHKGEVYEFPVVTRGKIWLLKAVVDAEETIEVAGERVPAFRIKAETNFPGVLKKRGDILFWISSGEDRRILKFKAKVKIGSIEGELTRYEPPKTR